MGLSLSLIGPKELAMPTPHSKEQEQVQLSWTAHPGSNKSKKDGVSAHARRAVSSRAGGILPGGREPGQQSENRRELEAETARYHAEAADMEAATKRFHEMERH